MNGDSLIASEAVFGFCGWLMTAEDPVVFGKGASKELIADLAGHS